MFESYHKFFYLICENFVTRNKKREIISLKYFEVNNFRVFQDMEELNLLLVV